MNWMKVVGKGFTSISKLGSVYVSCIITKRSAVKRFAEELKRQGLPRHVVERLTADYADMLSLNPIAYARGFMQKPESKGQAW